MSAEKDLDQRFKTKSGGVIRVETWVNRQSLVVVHYNLTYLNFAVMQEDDGRILGFDDAHWYPNFPSPHHEHRWGEVMPNLTYTSFSDLLTRFEYELLEMKALLGEAY